MSFEAELEIHQADEIVPENEEIYYESHNMQRQITTNERESERNDIDMNDNQSKSGKSRKSVSSCTSSVLAQKRAKAEAAKAVLQFAEKEAEIKKKCALMEEQRQQLVAQTVRNRADMEADLGLLTLQKNAAAAEAEYTALESELVETPGSRDLNNLPHSDPRIRTRQYVNQLPEVNNIETHQRDNAVSHPQPTKEEQIHGNNAKEFQGNSQMFHGNIENAQYSPQGYQRQMYVQNHEIHPQSIGYTYVHDFNQQNESFVRQNEIQTPKMQKLHPQKTVHVHQPMRNSSPRAQEDHPRNSMCTKEENISTELSRFLLKKELVRNRLTKYDDQPESYCIWKASFKSVMTELVMNPNEELDLLAKWLGVESSRHAQRLRLANVDNPKRGLQQTWERLDERYGSPELVESSLKMRLSTFPKLTNKDNRKLYDLSDLLSEILAIKQQEKYKNLLSYFDSSSGVTPIVSKLPYGLQEKWTATAVRYKRQHEVTFPPFRVFVDFIRDMSKIRNDPCFMYDYQPQSTVKADISSPSSYPRRNVSNRKTEVEEFYPSEKIESSDSDDPSKRCPIHKGNHPLKDCKTFRAKSYDERKKLLWKFNICFRCCASTNHRAADCQTKVKCTDCGSTRHLSALHSDSWTFDRPQSVQDHGGERNSHPPTDNGVTTKCTQICNGTFAGRSCAKTLLVNVYPEGQRDKRVRTYVIIDDQSNTSLAKTEFFNLMDIHTDDITYVMWSCAGPTDMSGRIANGFILESLDGSTVLKLPTVIECSEIPNFRDEIPTPDIARHHPHLSDIVDFIPPLDENADILMLIGRDLIEAHHVFDQRIGPQGAPYAQRLPLGWAIIGQVCLGKLHPPDNVRAKKTHLLSDGRPSLCSPCPNVYSVKETLKPKCDDIGSEVFQLTQQDEQIGMSVEDKEFLQMMDKEMYREPGGNWVSPLPFREPRSQLPNNRTQALKRAMTLDRVLQRDKVKREHFTAFMSKMLDNKHAEVASPLESEQECWYLPIFGVYHSQKPGQVRVVFDASAQHNGLSLNSVLLQGPDMSNSLLGILMRFRKESVAITADIQQMFFCFEVRDGHRDYLRFLWYRDNDPSKDLIDYRMRVHVFGNTSSPAIATYGLRRSARYGETDYGTDMKQFIERDFYVDDGLESLPTDEEAVDLLKRTQGALLENGNLHLHKIASNSSKVMESFPPNDRAKDLKDMDLGTDSLPIQRSLGVGWDLNTDTFRFIVSKTDKPYTRRGLLATVNSVYDPLGFAAPVTVQGKILLRDLVSDTKDWDEELPPDREHEWNKWKDSLELLENLQIPRMYLPGSCYDEPKEVHIFSDASEKAIAAVAYMRSTDQTDESQFGFILGKSKVAPTHGHTIPRLELCAAVLAVELGHLVSEHLDIPIDCIHFYTDSKVVLGYIHNKTRRFYVYVANRVERIRKLTKPDQWNYVPTDKNPADYGTRSSAFTHGNPWILGPSKFLKCTDSQDCEYPLSDPDTDKEVRPQTVTLKTKVVNPEAALGTERFQRYSSWKKLVKAISRLRQFVRNRQNPITCTTRVQAYQETEKFLIRQTQREAYSKEIDDIINKRPLQRNSHILSLDPYLDEDNVLRVGGRLKHANIDIGFKNPAIVPGKSHVATLLVRHYHEEVAHQGRHFTEGAVRSAGLWITGGKRLVSTVIHKCVQCRKLRGRQQTQKMSDLPADRLEPCPPFSNVGVDTFGPWEVVTRRTRGGSSNSKRWGIIFTCLSSRAVHIEVVEDMSSSSFINALRRFISLRGKVKIFRSDRGTNFVGATDDLQIDSVNVEDDAVHQYLYDKGVQWIFNTPHSSHMGGAWERMIGITRRILDSMMLTMNSKNLTHDVLVTLMAEVCAIINARPLVPVSSDSENPFVLSPSTLLTQKTDHVSNDTTEYDLKDLYKSQWKQVQALAQMFWKRWRSEYLSLLQHRQKWKQDCPNIKEDDVVLLRDKTVNRNEWPIARVMKVIPSDDNRVRKAVLRISRDGKVSTLTRPVSEMVMLVSEDKEQ